MDDLTLGSRLQDLLDRLRASRRASWPLFALLGAVACGTLLLAIRPAPARIAPPAEMPAAPSAPAGARFELLVHVAGAVRNPGLYEFPEGARVADAIQTAGGPTARADLDALNLAAELVDGTRIAVPVRGGAGVDAAAPAEPGLISINAADAADLETVPGIGPVTAAAILAYRDAKGGFASLEELLEVDGIGPATLESIRRYLTL